MARKRKRQDDTQEIAGLIISEVALYFLVYYLLYVLNASGNLWLGAAVLWALLNLTYVFCPFRKCGR